ncbi:MAG: calcium-binding protein [Microcoleaceae cyanobacterium]
MARFDGTPGTDILTGTQQADQMFGYQGFDALDGSGGNDIIYGNQQGDQLFGNGGSDFLYGGRDNDTLEGGSGNDWLYGDSGNDIVRDVAGFNTLYGGSGADLFIIPLNTNTGSVKDFNSSEGDFFTFETFRTSGGTGSFNSNSLSLSQSEDTPFFVEFKQEGEDLLIGTSLSEEYIVRMTGLGEEINDPFPLLSSFSLVYGDSYSSPFDSLTNPEGYQESNSLTNSETYDPLPDMIEAEAGLIQYIEELEVEGEGSEEQLEGVKSALSELQEDIANELTRREQEAGESDSLLLPETPQIEKQIFFVEEGTVIPPEFQADMMGSEVFTLPEGFFTPVEYESLF